MSTFFKVVLAAVVIGVAVGGLLGTIEARLPHDDTRRVASQPGADGQLGPQVEVPETLFEFGRMERGATMSHAFLVRNVGDEPLKLEVGSTTCKCTVGDLDKNQVEPGEETEVLLEWEAKVPPGPFRHGATIVSNDPRQSRIELSIEGEVVESSTMVPSELVYGTVRTGEAKTAKLYLISNLENEIVVSNYEVTDESMAEKVEVEIAPAEQSELPLPDATSGLQVSATYRAGSSVGPFLGWLVLETNLENSERLSIPLTGSVVGDVSVFGPNWNANQGLLRIGAVRSSVGQKVRLNVSIRGEYAKETELEVASIDPPELQVTLGERREMSEQLTHIPLLVEVLPGTRPMVRMTRPSDPHGESGTGDGQIVLKSTHPDTSEVVLNVRFSVEQ